MASSMLSAEVEAKTIARPAGNGMGNGLFAATNIAMGQEVLRIQKPFAAVLDSPRLQDTCSGCFGIRRLQRNQGSGSGAIHDHGDDDVAELKACTRCQVVRYCDKTCQSKDWKAAHSLECPIFSKLQPKVLPNNARAILRIILRHRKGKIEPQQLEGFLRLETHARDIRDTNQEQWNRILLSAKAVKEYSGVDMDEEYISSFFAKLEVNSFNLTTPFYDRIGLYMHPYAALMNHSCDYNAVVGFEGDQLFVKPVRPIRKDEQILISYIDVTNPRDVRRSDLRERYFFDCDCKKCEDKTAREDAFLAAAPDKSVVESTESRVNELVFSAAAEKDPHIRARGLESAIKVLNEASIWPITRQPYVSIRDELIVALLSAQRYDSAFAHATIRFLIVDPAVYPSNAHPVRQLHVWTLAKLAVHISQGYEPESHGDSLIQKSGINLAFIIWSLLARLITQEESACTSSTFKNTVRASVREVQEEFRINGVAPEKMGKEIEEEWAKLEKLARQALKQEGYRD